MDLQGNQKTKMTYMNEELVYDLSLRNVRIKEFRNSDMSREIKKPITDTQRNEERSYSS